MNETNRYATSHTSDGVLSRGDHWDSFTMVEIKVWLAIWLYIDMKWQPNMKSYWMKEGSVVHYLTILKIMTQDRFMTLITCFHIIDPTTYIKERDLLEYDKLGQTRWLINKILENCKRV